MAGRSPTLRIVRPGRRERPDAAGPLPDEARVADARRRVGHMLDQGMATAALQAHDKASRTLPGYRLEEAEHLRLIRGLLDAGAEAEAIGPMRSFIEHYPKRAHRVRLRLAQVLLDGQRPQAAARVLVAIPAGGLPEDLDALRRQLMDRARTMQDEGVLEVEGDLRESMPDPPRSIDLNADLGEGCPWDLALARPGLLGLRLLRGARGE